MSAPTNPFSTLTSTASTATLPWRQTALAMMVALGLNGCASKGSGSPDNEPTIASLAGREVSVAADTGIKVDAAKAIEAYRAFVAAAPNAPQRPEVLRRLADLEMDRVEARIADGRATGDKQDWKSAVEQHQYLLKTYPKQAGNDRVLYQLARAHELGGELEQSLAVLDRLVAEHPATLHLDEAHFRRGELLFTARDYVRAEAAYASVLRSAGGDSRRAFTERALYMKGWSQFKQGRLDDALVAFFGVLDLKLAGSASEAELSDLKLLSRADRDLVEDTFRVTSLSLQNLQGAASIPAFITTPERRGYEFRVHEQLAELYLKQERVKDAADTLGAFTKRDPQHARAPALQARVVSIYQTAGFAALALDAKKDHVQRYGVGSDYQRASPQAWKEQAQPLVKTHLSELAQHFHASAQKTRAPGDVKEAVHWYRTLLDSFPTDAKAPANRFLLAELLQSDGRLADAAREFETTAYEDTPHARSADAGYAALLAHGELEKKAAPADQPALQRIAADSAVRFSKAFKSDARTASVLTYAADKRFVLGDTAQASAIAQQVLDMGAQAQPAERQVAWTVVAHASFERGDFAKAEAQYAEVLATTGAQDAKRAALVERHAASIYKQGEAARTAGRNPEAAAHFARVVTSAPQSAVRANAQFDAAATLIVARDWAGAAQQLEDLRQRFPNHPLNKDVASKLALVYTEQQQWAAAAGEFERLAAAATDANVARDAQWHAAELFDKAGAKAPATRAYERYVAQHPQPLPTAIEARWRLATLAKDSGQTARELSLAKDIVQADATGGTDRTDRTRTLAALASLQLAQPTVAAYRNVALVEPLQRQLKLKKLKMEEAMAAFATVSGYGVPEAVTAATFHTAALYQDFGKTMMASQRPKKLGKAELEQYNVMLEEQAFPFEEKAIELHETNARRTAEGHYDAWVKRSFAALRELRPTRYSKAERHDQTLSQLQPLLKAHPALGGATADPGLPHASVGRTSEAVVAIESAVQASARPAPLHNLLGVALRQDGQFNKARDAYLKSIELDATQSAPVLNLGILHDLYLADVPRAAELYARYLAMTPAGDPAVTKWVAELKSRKPTTRVVARQEKP